MNKELLSKVVNEQPITMEEVMELKGMYDTLHHAYEPLEVIARFPIDVIVNMSTNKLEVLVNGHTEKYVPIKSEEEYDEYDYLDDDYYDDDDDDIEYLDDEEEEDYSHDEVYDTLDKLGDLLIHLKEVI